MLPSNLGDILVTLYKKGSRDLASKMEPAVGFEPTTGGLRGPVVILNAFAA